MTRRWILSLIVANLAGLGAVIFFYPQFMISPGPVAPAHTGIETDCFACHAPFRGAAAGRCVGCHAVRDIGLRTTKLIRLKSPRLKSAFHQQLRTDDCMACHSGHEGSLIVAGNRQSFSHELLLPAALTRCETCHTKPATSLHRGVSANCLQCHSQQRWKPATFDHAGRFLLEGVHDTACATCHVDADYSRYTCYGCHEHQADRIRAKHLREGIPKFESCAECHRNAGSEHGGRGSGRQEHGD